MNCCSRQRTGKKERILSNEEVTSLITEHQKQEKEQLKLETKRFKNIGRSVVSCICVTFVLFLLLASFFALQGGVVRGGVWDLLPQTKKNLVYLASLENHLPVQEQKVADFSGIWWWRKVQELTATEDVSFFMPKERELGLSFANITCPADGAIKIRPNSMHQTFYSKAGFFSWLSTLITLTFYDGANIKPVMDPNEEVTFEFNYPALNIINVSGSGQKFYLVKVDSDQWLQTNGIAGYTEANISTWALDLPTNGVSTSGYILTRVVNGGSGTANTNWWSAFTESVSPKNKTKVFAWETDNGGRRTCSWWLSWVPGFCELGFIYGEPPAPAVPNSSTCAIFVPPTPAPFVPLATPTNTTV
jgi:hypothetical protein